ncbi:uncharacterized protein B0H64DRAFT_352450 [Chaetomium fimeti]|uniref:J domain-containing protein n=1 Tax=Chaetomium fimeti TaxID=1854472 RepID=A0AAE0HS10_9PEZI|nr:hypothetical protein B0H64DRAFT_352450 [Chaetomium fimeti]
MASKAGRPPNYYSILEIPETASASQIRDAYKRAALKTHPDRIPTNHPDRAARTAQFQLVNDAYYTLSDTSRRREYDAQRKLYTGARPGSSTGAAGQPGRAGGGGGGGGGGGMPGGFDFGEEEEGVGGGEGGIPFSWAWDFFTGGQGRGQQGQEERARAEDAQFADVFEEMLREEGMAGQEGGAAAGGTGTFWGTMGGLSGAALGFIVANVPGLVAGAVAGNRLGAVRDAKGKSVYAVFQELPQTDRAKMLSQLAARVLSHAAGI